MAVTVYKKGESRLENGIMCDIATIDHTSLKNYIDAGWFLTPEETGGVQSDAPVVVKKETIAKKKDEVSLDKDVLGLGDIGKRYGRK